MTEEHDYTVLDESITFTLREFCAFCKVTDKMVSEMVNEGVLSPRGDSLVTWQFGAREVKRTQITIRLQRDLRINLPGVALALNLLDEIEALRQHSSSP